MLNKIYLLLCILVLSGCVPIPNRTQVIPKISGIITKNNIPMKSVKVVIYRNKYDKENGKAKIIIETDDRGEFRFQGDKDTHLFMMIGDPITTWSMDLVHNGTFYLGWKEFGIGYAEAFLNLSCELTYKTPENNIKQGICQIDR
ncbi:MAG: hypothetical protein KDI76_03970 [Xanthomonadales bacterium]|nr:hypothetical protein [Xanthomonadales bacterium]